MQTKSTYKCNKYLCMQNHNNSSTNDIATSTPKNMKKTCAQQKYDTILLIKSANVFQDTLLHSTIFYRQNI